MKFLRLILSIFAGKIWILSFGLVLTILSFASSVGLLTLSTWFLAACFIVHSMSLNIFYPSASIRGFAIGRTAFKYMQRMFTHKATFDVLAKLKVQAFAAFIPLATDINKLARLKKETEQNQEFITKFITKNKDNKSNQTNKQQMTFLSDNELFDRIMRDIDNLDGFYVNVAIPYIATLIILIIATIALCFIDLYLALFVGLSLIATVLIIPWIFYKRGKLVSFEVEQDMIDLRVDFLNYLELHIENLIFSKEAKRRAKLNKLNQQLIEKQLAGDQYINLTTIFMQCIMGTLITCTIFGAGGIAVLTSEDPRIVSLAAVFGFFVVGVIELVLPLAGLFFSLGQVVISASNLYSLLKDRQAELIAEENIAIHQERQVKNKADYTNFYPKTIEQSILDRLDSVQVSIKDLNFNYLDNKIIKHLNADFKDNTSYLIRGESGTGKTTLANCIIGIENSYSGLIEIKLLDANKQLITSLNAKDGMHRHLCAHLSQRVHIFINTVRDNLKIANPQATDEQIITVLNKVGLDYLATDLDRVLLGYRYLSGGEVRRLGVARILLTNAKLIVLDEPTESIDNVLEQQILNLIFEHSKQKKATLLMISHNKNNLDYYEHIVNFQNNSYKTEFVVK